jgi:hypothetical protein
MSIPTIPRVQQSDLPELLRTFDARKDSFYVYNRDKFMWLYGPGALYVKVVPDDTSVFLAFPRGTTMKLSAHKLLRMPVREHMDHLILFVRHFKYEGAVTKNEVYSWLKGFHGRRIILDEYYRDIPRFVSEQLRTKNLHGVFFRNGFNHYDPIDPTGPPTEIQGDDEVLACCYSSF